jgi:hypothetical protein
MLNNSAKFVNKKDEYLKKTRIPILNNIDMIRPVLRLPLAIIKPQL